MHSCMNDDESNVNDGSCVGPNSCEVLIFTILLFSQNSNLHLQLKWNTCVLFSVFIYCLIQIPDLVTVVACTWKIADTRQI